jgi:hypothetical protein
LFGAILVLMVFGLIQVLWSSKTIVSKITTPVSGFGWILIVCLYVCRFSFHWASYLLWSMVAWQQLYFVAISYMTQTTWSRDTPMTSSFGLLSRCIWTSSTFSCLCSLFSELLIVRILVFLGTYYLFSVGWWVVFENNFLSGNKSFCDSLVVLRTISYLVINPSMAPWLPLFLGVCTGLLLLMLLIHSWI